MFKNQNHVDRLTTELAKRIQLTTACNFTNTANALHPNCHFAGIIFIMWNSSISLDDPKRLGARAAWMGYCRGTLTPSSDLLPSTGHRFHTTHFWIQHNNRQISWEVSLGAAAGPSQGGGQVTPCRIGPFGGGNHKAHLISARGSSTQLCHVKYQQN